jgi:zona occludens toxin
VDAKTPAATLPGDIPLSGLETATPAPSFVDDRVDFIPRVSHVPESAPAYDNLRRVVNMPVVSGVLCKGKKCTCFSQQGTALPIDPVQCKEFFDNPSFDHYRVPDLRPMPAPKPAPPVAVVPGQTELPAPFPAINPKAESRPVPFAIRNANLSGFQ